MKAGLNIYDLKRMHSFMAQDPRPPVKAAAKKFDVSEEYVKANTPEKLAKWQKEAREKRQAEVKREASRRDIADILLKAAVQAQDSGDVLGDDL